MRGFNLKSRCEVFTTLCQRFLSGQVCANDFICAFEELYIAAEITLSEREFLVFDGIHTNNDRFEPNHKLRRTDSYLIDETELRRLIQKGVRTLAA
jgi:hypothetical protein